MTWRIAVESRREQDPYFYRELGSFLLRRDALESAEKHAAHLGGRVLNTGRWLLPDGNVLIVWHSGDDE